MEKVHDDVSKIYIFNHLIIHDSHDYHESSDGQLIAFMWLEDIQIQEKCDGGGILFGGDMVGEEFLSDISNNGGGGNLEKY